MLHRRAKSKIPMILNLDTPFRWYASSVPPGHTIYSWNFKSHTNGSGDERKRSIQSIASSKHISSCLQTIDDIINDVNDWRPDLPANPGLNPKINPKGNPHHHPKSCSDVNISTKTSHINSKVSPTAPTPKTKKKEKKMKIYTPSYTAEYFDTHCHLDWLLKRKFNGYQVLGFHHIVDEHFNGNFGGALTVACWPDQYEIVKQLIYNEHTACTHIYGSFGIHPRIANQWNKSIKQQIVNLVTADREREMRKIVAVGECGLDYSNMEVNASKLEQEQAFREQIALSITLDLPLVVHSRMAEEDTYRVMTDCCPKDKAVHLHCLTDSLGFAKGMLQYFPNLKVGFTGTILFKSNVELRKTVKNVPLDRIMLETDAPFFGSAVHPGYIPKIAEKVAECHGISDANKVIQQCRENARVIYGV